MILGKRLSGSWQEALSTLANCRVVSATMTEGTTMELLMRDPVQQEFVLVIKGAYRLSLGGDTITINSGLEITSFEKAEVKNG